MSPSHFPLLLGMLGVALTGVGLAALAPNGHWLFLMCYGIGMVSMALAYVLADSDA
jgi:hypothetical protein